MTPESLTQQELDGAVDMLIDAYNTSRSTFLGHNYASAYLLASDEHLAAAVRAVLVPCYSEIERLTGHSKQLNTIAFRIAEALVDVPHGQDWTEGNPVELADRLIAELAEAREAIEDHQMVVDTDAYRLAAGTICVPGQTHGCGDAHHIGRCYKPTPEHNPQAVTQ